MTGSFSLLSGSSLGALGQALELLLVGDETLAVVGLGHYVLAELQGEQTQLLVDGFQALLFVSREVGAVVGEALVGLGEQTHLFGRETPTVAMVIHILDAGKECIVEDDRRRELREHRADLLGDSVHLIVAVGLQHIEEHAAHTVEQQTAAVEGDDSVLKGRDLAAVDDSVDLGFVLTNSLLEGRQVMLRLHLVKRRHAVRGLGLNKQRVSSVASK